MESENKMLNQLNNLPMTEAIAVLQRCCGSSKWALEMASLRPFSDLKALHQAADDVWESVSKDDVLEAFQHHPKIGADIVELRKKFATTASWSSGEQSAVASANETTLEALRDGNIAYEEKFGYIFIVCATGKTAEEMLEILQARLPNEPDSELQIAKGEQAKITHLRLEKLQL